MSEEPTRGYTLDELSSALANGSISRGRALKLLAAMAVAAVVPARLAAAAPPAGKTTICHKGKNTITVSDNALPAHLGTATEPPAHEGDYLGPCTTTTKKPTTTTTTTKKPYHTTTTTTTTKRY
jgi:hypothetical protein